MCPADGLSPPEALPSPRQGWTAGKGPKGVWPWLGSVRWGCLVWTNGQTDRQTAWEQDGTHAYTIYIYLWWLLPLEPVFLHFWPVTPLVIRRYVSPLCGCIWRDLEPSTGYYWPTVGEAVYSWITSMFMHMSALSMYICQRHFLPLQHRVTLCWLPSCINTPAQMRTREAQRIVSETLSIRKHTPSMSHPFAKWPFQFQTINNLSQYWCINTPHCLRR